MHFETHKLNYNLQGPWKQKVCVKRATLIVDVHVTLCLQKDEHDVIQLQRVYSKISQLELGLLVYQVEFTHTSILEV